MRLRMTVKTLFCRHLCNTSSSYYCNIKYQKYIKLEQCLEEQIEY